MIENLRRWTYDWNNDVSKLAIYSRELGYTSHAVLRVQSLDDRGKRRLQCCRVDPKRSTARLTQYTSRKYHRWTDITLYRLKLSSEIRNEVSEDYCVQKLSSPRVSGRKPFQSVSAILQFFKGLSLQSEIPVPIRPGLPDMNPVVPG